MAKITCNKSNCQHQRNGLCQLQEISNTMSFVEPECPYFEKGDGQQPGPGSGEASFF